MKTFREFMAEAPILGVTGQASSYGPGLYGNKTASGQVLTPQTLGIAHKTLPLGSNVRLTDKSTGRSIVVPVIDRGPYVGNRHADITDATVKQMGYKGGWKEFGVRSIDVTPVPKASSAAKSKPIDWSKSKITGAMYGKY